MPRCCNYFVEAVVGQTLLEWQIVGGPDEEFGLFGPGAFLPVIDDEAQMATAAREEDARGRTGKERRHDVLWFPIRTDAGADMIEAAGQERNDAGEVVGLESDGAEAIRGLDRPRGFHP